MPLWEKEGKGWDTDCLLLRAPSRYRRLKAPHHSNHIEFHSENDYLPVSQFAKPPLGHPGTITWLTCRCVVTISR